MGRDLVAVIVQSLPEQIVAHVRTAPIYPWAAQWYAMRREERQHWSESNFTGPKTGACPKTSGLVCVTGSRVADHMPRRRHWPSAFGRFAELLGGLCRTPALGRSREAP